MKKEYIAPNAMIMKLSVEEEILVEGGELGVSTYEETGQPTE